MDVLLKFIPDSLKLPIVGGFGLVLGAGLMFWPASIIGGREARQAIEISAAKDALSRIQTMEQNNAKFRTLSDRDRCLVFMRDSGLPDGACDQR